MVAVIAGRMRVALSPYPSHEFTPWKVRQSRWGVDTQHFHREEIEEYGNVGTNVLAFAKTVMKESHSCTGESWRIAKMAAWSKSESWGSSRVLIR